MNNADTMTPQPTMTFPMLAQLENIHIAAFP
jgi:hypothetical protein